MKTIRAWCDKTVELDAKGGDEKRFVVCQDCRASVFKHTHTSIMGPAPRPLPPVT
jgi:hypothetical protein